MFAFQPLVSDTEVLHYRFFLDESSIGMMHSNLHERNVGKSLTLDILAKARGVGDRSHPTMLAGGGVSV